MANLHIVREHTLGLPAARKIAFAWAEQVESDFGMECTYEEGKTLDTVTFERSGVRGTLAVNAKQFELEATLGFLLGAFKDRIEAEIVKNLDELMKPAQPDKAAKAAIAAQATKPTTRKK